MKIELNAITKLWIKNRFTLTKLFTSIMFISPMFILINSTPAIAAKDPEPAIASESGRTETQSAFVALKAPAPNEGVPHAKTTQGAVDESSKLKRIDRLSTMALSTIGLTQGRFKMPFPYQKGVRMDRLREVFQQTTAADIPLLVEMYFDSYKKGVNVPEQEKFKRSALMFLIAMYGDVALAEFNKAITQHPEHGWPTAYDRNAIAQLAEFKLWEKE